jgi:hypothetical protein
MMLKRHLAPISVLVLALIACNIQASQSSQPDLPGTITAQALTLQARGSTAIPAIGTPSEPWISVTSSTECRAGPGTQYGILFTLNPGGAARVVGKNAATGHWIIENPAGDPCWLPEQDAVFTGDAGALTDYPVPAAPTSGPTGTPKPTKTPKASKTPTLTFTATIGVPYTPGVPNFPTYVTAYKTCESTTVGPDKYWIQGVTLTWHDTADNETGYRIYVAAGSSSPGLGDTLGPNSTSYTFEEQYTEWSVQFQPYEQFWVAAYNDVGESIRMGALLYKCP